jgi:hypothetical protein
VTKLEVFVSAYPNLNQAQRDAINPLTVPRFLVRPKGELPIFIRRLGRRQGKFLGCQPPRAV